MKARSIGSSEAVQGQSAGLFGKIESKTFRRYAVIIGRWNQREIANIVMQDIEDGIRIVCLRCRQQTTQP